MDPWSFSFTQSECQQYRGIPSTGHPPTTSRAQKAEHCHSSLAGLLTVFQKSGEFSPDDSEDEEEELASLFLATWPHVTQIGLYGGALQCTERAQQTSGCSGAAWWYFWQTSSVVAPWFCLWRTQCCLSPPPILSCRATRVAHSASSSEQLRLELVSLPSLDASTCTAPGFETSTSLHCVARTSLGAAQSVHQGWRVCSHFRSALTLSHLALIGLT